MVTSSRDPSEKLAGEIRQLIERWRLEWNISIHEIIGALDTARFDLQISRWSITEEPIDDDPEEDDD
tara:strand:+ start:300 stop:500 length:201 start_codon:yes stop_codon:yes gene_type:complete